MMEIGFTLLFISKNYKGLGIIPSDKLEAFENIGNKIAKEFGVITKETHKGDAWFNFWDHFVEDHSTLESVRDFLVNELYYGSNVAVYGISPYDYRVTLTLSNGKRIEYSMIDRIVMYNNTPEKSLLGKNFKNNWKIYNEIKRIVESMF